MRCTSVEAEAMDTVNTPSLAINLRNDYPADGRNFACGANPYLPLYCLLSSCPITCLLDKSFHTVVTVTYRV